MKFLKVIVLMVVVFSVLGIQAKEILLEQLNEEAGKAYEKSDYETALEKWQEGLQQAHKIGNQYYIGRFIGNLGLVYHALRQYQKALDSLQQALVIFREIGEKNKEGASLVNLGIVYSDGSFGF